MEFSYIINVVPTSDSRDVSILSELNFTLFIIRNNVLLETSTLIQFGCILNHGWDNIFWDKVKTRKTRSSFENTMKPNGYDSLNVTNFDTT